MSDDGTAASARDQGLTPDNHGRAGDIAEQERQFRELLEHCPAALDIVDEEGRILFHNARLRELMGYDENELHLFDTKSRSGKNLSRGNRL